MDILETEIKYQGRTLKQIKREGNVALYQMENPYGYEVVIIRTEKGREKFGKFYPEHEAYPSSEEWGTYGWTYRPDELEKAEKRFASLLPKYGANVAQVPKTGVSKVSEGKDGGV
jgi:hypothetical protein